MKPTGRLIPRAMNRGALLIVMLAVLVSVQNAAADPKLPKGTGKYIVVFRPYDPAKDPQPDKGNDSSKRKELSSEVERLGGALLSDQGDYRVITLPAKAVKNVHEHASVLYVQRIWMGEPLSEWEEEDPPGPRALRAQAESVDGDLSWATGTYLYDGSGNIKSIGSDTYAYDEVGRLKQATVNGAAQTYTYDSYGNMVGMTTAGAASTVTGGGLDEQPDHWGGVRRHGQSRGHFRENRVLVGWAGDDDAPAAAVGLDAEVSLYAGRRADCVGAGNLRALEDPGHQHERGAA